MGIEPKDVVGFVSKDGTYYIAPNFYKQFYSLRLKRDSRMKHAIRKIAIKARKTRTKEDVDSDLPPLQRSDANLDLQKAMKRPRSQSVAPK